MTPDVLTRPAAESASDVATQQHKHMNTGNAATPAHGGRRLHARGHKRWIRGRWHPRHILAALARNFWVLARLGGHRRATKRASIDVQQCPVSISQSPSRRSPSKHATSTQQAHAQHERTIEQTYYVKQAPSGAMSGVLARICVSISDTRVLVRPSVSFFYLNPSKMRRLLT